MTQSTSDVLDPMRLEGASDPPLTYLSVILNAPPTLLE